MDVEKKFPMSFSTQKGLEGRGEGHPRGRETFWTIWKHRGQSKDVFKKTESVAPTAEQKSQEIVTVYVGQKPHLVLNLKL